MKIKILKDIPGYKAGEIIQIENKNNKLIFSADFATADKPAQTNSYSIIYLLAHDFAEEIKDDIDIEAIRKSLRISKSLHINEYGSSHGLNSDELNFFTAYRIVKTVIDQLNGNWKPDWNDEDQNKNLIIFNVETQKFNSDNWFSYNPSILGVCKNKNVSEKIIKLCEPELKILFGVK